MAARSGDGAPRRDRRRSEPEVVVSDQLAFGATLAWRALERPHVSFHPGHPAAIPGPGELYGFPSQRRSSSAPTRGSWPNCAASAPRSPSASRARSTTRSVSSIPVPSRSRRRSPPLPAAHAPQLPGAARRAAARAAPAVGPVRRRLGSAGRRTERRARHAPRGGGFATAHLRLARQLPLRARGRSSARRLGVSHAARSSGRRLGRDSPLRSRSDPARLARRLVPPAARGAALVRSRSLPRREQHGHRGPVGRRPLLVCPFSTDQFAGAEDVRRAGLGDVFDPNAAAPEEIADRALRVLAGLETAGGRARRRAEGAVRAAAREPSRRAGGCASVLRPRGRSSARLVL